MSIFLFLIHEYIVINFNFVIFKFFCYFVLLFINLLFEIGFWFYQFSFLVFCTDLPGLFPAFQLSWLSIADRLDDEGYRFLRE